MKTVYVLTKCRNEGSHEPSALAFDSLDKAKEKLAECVDVFKKTHDLNEWNQATKNKSENYSFFHKKEPWSYELKIEELSVEDNANEIYTVLVDDEKNKAFFLKPFSADYRTHAAMISYIRKYTKTPLHFFGRNHDYIEFQCPTGD